MTRPLGSLKSLLDDNTGDITMNMTMSDIPVVAPGIVSGVGASPSMSMVSDITRPMGNLAELLGADDTSDITLSGILGQGL